jgi:hypothetical protein
MHFDDYAFKVFCFGVTGVGTLGNYVAGNLDNE